MDNETKNYDAVDFFRQLSEYYFDDIDRAELLKTLMTKYYRSIYKVFKLCKRFNITLDVDLIDIGSDTVTIKLYSLTDEEVQSVLKYIHQLQVSRDIDAIVSEYNHNSVNIVIGKENI